MVAQGSSNTQYSQNYKLAAFPDRKIKKGTVEKFQANPRIPDSIVRDTCMGAITAIFFDIYIQGSLGCCNYSPPRASIRLHLYASQLAISVVDKVSPPQDWNPQVLPTVYYNNMKPFVYRPCGQIVMIMLGNLTSVAH